jgi:hypothetical protein
MLSQALYGCLLIMVRSPHKQFCGDCCLDPSFCCLGVLVCERMAQHLLWVLAGASAYDIQCQSVGVRLPGLFHSCTCVQCWDTTLRPLRAVCLVRVSATMLVQRQWPNERCVAAAGAWLLQPTRCAHPAVIPWEQTH